MRVTRRQLDSMDEVEVLRLVSEDPKFQQKHLQKNKKVTRVTLYPLRGGGAQVSITTKKNVVSDMQEEAI